MKNKGLMSFCFLDINATHEKRGILYDVVASVAEQCFMPLTVGGGVRTLDDIRQLLLAGADKVSINSAAVAEPEFVRAAARKFGNQCIVVAVDTRWNSAGEAEIFTHGGRKATGLSTVEWARRMESYGAGEILLTSMDRDGTKQGFDNKITRMVVDEVGIPVVASGGVGELQDFVDGVKDGGASALLAASIFHFGEQTIGDVKKYMEKNGVAVRL